jgi:hypothetical protein
MKYLLLQGKKSCVIYGIFNEETLAVGSKSGYTNVFWSIAYKDWDTNDQKGWRFYFNLIQAFKLIPLLSCLIYDVPQSFRVIPGNGVKQDNRPWVKLRYYLVIGIRSYNTLSLYEIGYSNYHKWTLKSQLLCFI